MTSDALHIAPGFDLPRDIATEAVAILARRGRGKTYTASVVAEELVRISQPFVVLDPTGAWWGLRASADGRRPGLPVTIIGGEHGDVPLEPTAGKMLASFVVENPGAYVLDLSGFESGAAQDRFVTAFADRLYRAKANDRSPLTLIVDEADSFAPQRPLPGQATMLGAFESIVRRGRIRGLGVVLITQRPAVLNKNVLTQVGLLVLLGLTSPQDRKAVDDWIGDGAAKYERQEVLSSLARLDVGEAWVWWPTEDMLKRVKVRKRQTFDSSTTPKAGEARDNLAFAPVDLDALKSEMAATIARERDNDVDLLKARLRGLEEELRLREQQFDQREPEVVERVVNMPVVPVAYRERLADAIDGYDDAIAAMGVAQARLLALRDDVEAGEFGDVAPAVPAAPPGPRPKLAPAIVVPGPRPPIVVDGDAPLGEGEVKVLEVLATHDGLSLSEMAFHAGYSRKSSTPSVVVTKLRKLGLVEAGQPLRLTAKGLRRAGGRRVLPSGPALLQHWMVHPKMGDGERKVLRALLDVYPEGMTHPELCDATGYSASSSTPSVVLTQLRKLGLIEPTGRRVRDDFAAAIQ